MKTRWLPAALIVLDAAAISAQAGPPWISDEKAKELAALLPEPPAEGCPETKAELSTIRNCQKACTPQDTARIGTQARLTPVTFQDVLGPWFTEDKLPKTLQLLGNVNREAKRCCDTAKQCFNRRRPHFVNAEIKPLFPGLEEPCYPSGHAVQAAALGLVIAELAPNRRAAVMERACEIGCNRIPAGVHYPSNCTAGRVLGAAVTRTLLADADFRTVCWLEDSQRRRQRHLPPRKPASPNLGQPPRLRRAVQQSKAPEQPAGRCRQSAQPLEHLLHQDGRRQSYGEAQRQAGR